MKANRIIALAATLCAVEVFAAAKPFVVGAEQVRRLVPQDKTEVFSLI